MNNLCTKIKCPYAHPWNGCQRFHVAIACPIVNEFSLDWKKQTQYALYVPENFDCAAAIKIMREFFATDETYLTHRELQQNTDRLLTYPAHDASEMAVT